MLQAARPAIRCSGRFHKLHLHAKHKKYSWLIRLSAPMHNDFAACVWLPPPSPSYCLSLKNWCLEKVRNGTLKVAPTTFKTLNCYASCVLWDCADKALPVLRPPSCLQDCCGPCNIKAVEEFTCCLLCDNQHHWFNSHRLIYVWPNDRLMSGALAEPAPFSAFGGENTNACVNCTPSFLILPSPIF